MSKQLVKSRFDGRIFLRGPRNQIPPQEESALEQLRTFAQWLLIVPVVLTLIFSIGQLAVLLNTDLQLARTNSNLSAEYGPWEFVPVRALREEIINEIRIDFMEKTSIGESILEPIEESDRNWLEVLSNPIVIEVLPSNKPSISTPIPSSLNSN